MSLCNDMLSSAIFGPAFEFQDGQRALPFDAGAAQASQDQMRDALYEHYKSYANSPEAIRLNKQAELWQTPVRLREDVQ